MKTHTTVARHQEDKQSKATSSLFPIKMLAELEWTQSNAQQIIEQLQNPAMGETINNKSTTTDYGLRTDSSLSLSFPTIAMYNHRETI